MSNTEQKETNIKQWMNALNETNLHFQSWAEGRKMSALHKDEQGDWQTVCLKYLLFIFNFLFWVSASKYL